MPPILAANRRLARGDEGRGVRRRPHARRAQRVPGRDAPDHHQHGVAAERRRSRPPARAASPAPASRPGPPSPAGAPTRPASARRFTSAMLRALPRAKPSPRCDHGHGRARLPAERDRRLHRHVAEADHDHALALEAPRVREVVVHAALHLGREIEGQAPRRSALADGEQHAARAARAVGAPPSRGSVVTRKRPLRPSREAAVMRVSSRMGSRSCRTMRIHCESSSSLVDSRSQSLPVTGSSRGWSNTSLPRGKLRMLCADAALLDHLEREAELLGAQRGADARGAGADDDEVHRLRGPRCAPGEARRDALDGARALVDGVLDERQARDVAREVEAGHVEALEIVAEARAVADRLAVGDAQRSVRAALLAEREAAAGLGARDDRDVALDLEHVVGAGVDAGVAAEAGAWCRSAAGAPARRARGTASASGSAALPPAPRADRGPARTPANASAAAKRPAPSQAHGAPPTRRRARRARSPPPRAPPPTRRRGPRCGCWRRRPRRRGRIRPRPRAGRRPRRAGGRARCSSKQTMGRASPSASWPARRQRAIGSAGEPRAWHPLQLPAVGMATVARPRRPEGEACDLRLGARREAHRRRRPARSARPGRRRWMVWQVAQVIAPAASAARVPAPRSRGARRGSRRRRGAAGGAAAPGAGSTWQEAQARPAFSWGSESGPGAPPPPGAGTRIAAAIVAARAGDRRREDAPEARDVARGLRARRPATRSRAGLGGALARVGEARAVEGAAGSHARVYHPALTIR